MSSLVGAGDLSLSTIRLAVGPEDVHLRAALGLSLIFTRGESEAAREAISRGLAIAEQRGDAPDQLQLLGLLHMFHHRIGDFRTALSTQSAAPPSRIPPPSRQRIACWGFRFITWVTLAARIWSLRRPGGMDQLRSGPARSISASITTIGQVAPWQGTCGCKVIRPRPWNWPAKPSMTPHAWVAR